MLARVRDYFAARDVLAVDTPALSAWACPDPNIEAMAVRVAAGSTQFLHTSPEAAMKCLLAAGFPDIYSISRVFRAGERGRRHLPEFTLLEWYRRDFALPAIIADTVALIAACLERPDLEQSVKALEYADVFRQHFDIDIFSCSVDALQAASGADKKLCAALGVDRDTWLDLLLSTSIAPTFAADRLSVLRHYPLSQAALARPCPNDARVADRFEIFFGSLELANGYVELTDAGQQRARFEADNTRRAQRGETTIAFDTHLLAALESGLPRCAGVAVGFERLHMLYEGTDDIADVVCFTARSDDG